MPKEKIKKVGDHLLHNDSLVFTFLRSAVSSQAGAWSDMAVRFILFYFVFVPLDLFYRSNLSVACGAIVGGVVNCTLNYHFTFHASGLSVKAVIVKYIMVWTGSLLLNMYGTTFAAIAMSKWQWLLEKGFTEDGIFTVATLAVSLAVSWFWNFVLQRYFVYRPSRFDPTAIAIVNLFLPNKNTKQQRNNEHQEAS